MPSSADIDVEEPDEPELKFSLAGLQMKFSVYSDERGLTLPISGRAGNNILKLPDMRPEHSGVPESEMAGILLAKEIGIEVPEVRLVRASDVEGLEKWAKTFPGNSLMIQRFDRFNGDQRIHSEEFAQILNISTGRYWAKYRRANYETIAGIAAGLMGVDAVGKVIDRTVLNVAIGNGDAHLKNWAVRYLDGKTPSLSPAYDIVPTILYIANDDLGVKLNGTKEFHAIRSESFERLGERTGYGAQEARSRARETAARVIDKWSTLRDGLTREQFRRLNAHRSNVPLFREVH